MARSDVARLRNQIELELDAMQRGFTDFAAGTARHEFIRTRLERVGSYQELLTRQIGENEANEIVCVIYTEVMEREIDSPPSQELLEIAS